MSTSVFSMEEETTNNSPPFQKIETQDESFCYEYGPAYNAPAVINVNCKNCMCNMGMFFDGSFTYWFASEEGLPIASNGVLNSGTLFFPQNITTVFQTFDYKPGFKIGVGFVGEHEWVFHAE